MTDSQSREPGFKWFLCYHFRIWAFSLSPRCPSPLSCISGPSHWILRYIKTYLYLFLPFRCSTGLTWTSTGCSEISVSTSSTCLIPVRRRASSICHATRSATYCRTTAVCRPTNSSSSLTGASGGHRPVFIFQQSTVLTSHSAVRELTIRVSSQFHTLLHVTS